MSDGSRIRSALKRAASDGRIGSGPASFSSPEGGAARILDALDAIVMPRHMTLVFDTGREVGCEVAGRRLVRFVAPAPDGLSPGESELFDGRELTAEDADHAVATLMAVCRDCASVQIRTGGVADTTETGIETTTLLSILGVGSDEDDSAPGDALDRIAAALEDRMQASLFVHDETMDVLLGDGDAVTELGDWAADMLERVLAPGFPLASMLETDGIAVFAFPGTSGCHAMIAGRLGQYLVALFDGADPSETLAAWRELRG
ncbi:hypothetical protein HKCCE3408_10665 [Rhodobacterales bacterium HKCCE3408]|nr:hypothetical protein [Rhodobacterales bacterium HKCCE3408]